MISKKLLANTTGGQGNLVKKILFLDEIHRFNKAQAGFFTAFGGNRALTLIGRPLPRTPALK